MSNESPAARVQKIDVALNRYYQSLDVVYANQFINFCRINGYDESVDNDNDPLQDELDEEASECMLPDAFGDTFPFNDEYKDKQDDVKHEFIYNLIKRCDANPNILFENGYETQNNINGDDESAQSNDDQQRDTNNQQNQPRKVPTQNDDYQQYLKNNPMVKKICNQLHQRYKEKNIAYDRMFSSKCKDQELDDEAIQVSMTCFVFCS